MGNTPTTTTTSTANSSNNTSSHPWIRPTDDFVATPKPRPENAASIDIKFYVEKATNHEWLAKCSINSIINNDYLEQLKKIQHDGFHSLSKYFEEIMEKVASELYKKIGVATPATTLSFQKISEEGENRLRNCTFENPAIQGLYLFSKFVPNFVALDKNFEQNYLQQKRLNPKISFHVKGRKGNYIPLKGLGMMLAAANFLLDPDCIGNTGNNAGYIIWKDDKGEEYAQLVKIDTGYALSFYGDRYDKKDNLFERKIAIAPSGSLFPYAELNDVDKQEFCEASLKILKIPQVEYEEIINHAYSGGIFLPEKEKKNFSNQLISRKNIFLGVFSHDAGDVIRKEIENAEAELAKKLGSKSQSRNEETASMIEEQRKQVEIANVLFAQLAKHESKEDLSGKGSCKTFQLPKENKSFSGRKNILPILLKQLYKKKTGVVSQSVKGLGGVGKTQLVLKYAYEAKSKYSSIIWLRADGSLGAQFQELASAWLNVENLKPGEAKKAVYTYLINKSALLIFDNAENANSISEYLPPTFFKGNLHVLITSRNREWGRIPSFSLEGFSLEEAKEYMMKELDEETFGSIQHEEFETLHKLLTGLPLAYSQAISYIKDNECNVNEFIKEFRLNQSSMWNDHLNKNEPHPKTVDTVVILSLARAKMKHEKAELLLVICSYLNPDGIQIGLLSDITKLSIQDVEQGVKALESVSLLSYENTGVNIHRLVQEMVRYRKHYLMNENLRERIIGALDKALETNPQTTKSVSKYVQHVFAFTSSKRGLLIGKEQELKLAVLLEKAGDNQRCHGQYSIELISECLEIRERLLGEKHISTVVSYNNVGNTYRDLGDYQIALEYSMKALELNKEILGEKHPNTITSYCNVGMIHRDLGDYQKALGYSMKALELRKEILGEKHPDIAISYNNVGSICRDLGEYQKALGYKRITLELNKEIFGEKHLNTVSSYNNLGSIYKDLGDYQKALYFSMRALELSKDMLGEKHPLLAMPYNNVGIIYRELGDCQTALEYTMKALEIRKEILGEKHPDTTMSYSNVGLAYRELGDYQKALEYSMKALELRKEILERNILKQLCLTIMLDWLIEVWVIFKKH